MRPPLKPVLRALALFSIFASAGTLRAQASAAVDPAQGGRPPGRLKILGLSLLVPGLGHRALGLTNRSYAFMGAEATIWGAFGVFEAQGKIRKDSYVEMAHIFGGVRDASGRDGEYYRLLGSYRTSEDYNDEVRRDARARYGDDLQGRADYFEQHRIRDDLVWSWSSRDDWDRYQDKRRGSNEAYKRAGTMIGLAVANRLLAAVDALRIAHRADPSRAMSFYLAADPGDPGAPARFCVSLPLR